MRQARMSPRRIAAAVGAVAICLVLLTAACGGGKTTTTLAPTTTTLPETTTTVAPTTTTEPETTTTSEAATTTTEALSSAETRLADGTIKGMGFIDKVWEKGGTRYLSIDYAEMLTGQAAIDAAKAAGDPPPEDDYYIRNTNPKKREFTVSASAVITTATRAGGQDEPATWKEFLSFWSPKPPAGDEHLHMVPWWIIRNGTEVISIAEQYLP